MTDSIDLENGELWGGASWMVSGILKDIARSMSNESVNIPFSNWLLDLSNRPNGMASFDVRGLTSEQKDTFFKAAQTALKLKKTEGSKNWAKPEYFESYILYFTLLAEGKPSPHYKGTTKWNGEKINFCDLWQTNET